MWINCAKPQHQWAYGAVKLKLPMTCLYRNAMRSHKTGCNPLYDSLSEDWHTKFVFNIVHHRPPPYFLILHFFIWWTIFRRPCLQFVCWHRCDTIIDLYRKKVIILLLLPWTFKCPLEHEKAPFARLITPLRLWMKLLIFQLQLELLLSYILQVHRLETVDFSKSVENEGPSATWISSRVHCIFQMAKSLKSS